MNSSTLLKQLQEVHDQLAQTDKIDEETLELVRTVATDALDVLARNDPGEFKVEPLRKAVQDLVVQQELEHPAVVGLLRRLVDGLATMGI